MSAVLGESLERALRKIAATPIDNPVMATHRECMAALLAEIDRLRAEATEGRRYAAALEAVICQCEPLCEGGEYLHAADCPVASVQMQSFSSQDTEAGDLS